MIGIDKRLLIDSVTIQKESGKDDWGKVVLEEPITLEPVRFDRKFVVEGTANNRSKSKPSLLFVYPKYCQVVLDDSFENAVVVDGKHNYRVTSVTPVYYPHNRKIFCYELECV